MKVEFQEKKRIYSLSTEVAAGSFAMDAVPLEFQHCREQFAAKFTKDTSSFYFRHKMNQNETVAAFILKTEDILQEDDHSQFSETNRSTILWVQPAMFWRACSVKRSLFTILLRAGMAYDLSQDNYEEALFGQEFVVPTRRAVMRFLYGFTKYAGIPWASGISIEKCGWKSVFEGKSEAEIKSLLVRPKEFGYIPTEELALALWA